MSKKILIILRDITEHGGGERVCANLSNALMEVGIQNLNNKDLQAKKYHVDILSFYKQNNAPFYEIKSQVTYLSHATMKHKGIFKKLFHKLIYRFYLNHKALRYIESTKPDIILANDGIFRPTSKIASAKYLRLWHLNFISQKSIFESFDSLIIPSSKEIDKWKETHSNVCIVPNFLPYFPKTLSSHRNKRILALGRMTAQKDFSRLIDIYHLIAKDFLEWELVIAGDGELRDSLVQKVEQLGMQECVKILPFSKDVQSLYHSASIYAMTSVFEGFGMVLAEAASYGIVSIAFDINAGPSDIIEDNVSGFLIKERDNRIFADKLALLMGDESLRKKMGESARNIMEKRFSKEAVLQKWQEIFD